MDTHPGFATDLLFDRYQGNVVAHEQFWTVRTPDVPDYYFGNYLLLPTPPSDRDKGWLEASFDKLIGQDPRVQHRTGRRPKQPGRRFRGSRLSIHGVRGAGAGCPQLASTDGGRSGGGCTSLQVRRLG